MSRLLLVFDVQYTTQINISIVLAVCELLQNDNILSSFIPTLIKGHLKTKLLKINEYFLVRKKNVIVQSLLFEELELKPKLEPAPQH